MFDINVWLNIVIEKLQNCGALLAQQDIQHSYPHCWRCKKPVIYRATPQWFVKVDKFREKTLEEIKNVKWIPASGEVRISNMVASRTDCGLGKDSLLGNWCWENWICTQKNETESLPYTA